MMAQLEGMSERGCLSLEKWVQEKKITVNLYNHLTSVEPPYTVELLLLMSQSDVKQLKHDFNNVNFTEILQLINILNQLPQSQINHDIMNQNNKTKIVYSTPQQHSSTGEFITKLSNKLHNAKTTMNKNEQACDRNMLLINNTFDTMIQFLHDTKLSLIKQIKHNHLKQGEKLLQQESASNQFSKFTEAKSRDNSMLTSNEHVQKEDENEIENNCNAFEKMVKGDGVAIEKSNHDGGASRNKSMTMSVAGVIREVPVGSIEQLPEWIRAGCRNNGITELNEMQSAALKTMAVGNDTRVVSPCGSGKTTLACISALFRLYVRRGTAHVVIVCATPLHVAECHRQLRKSGSNAPDCQFHLLQRGRSLPKEALERGKNVFVCDYQALAADIPLAKEHLTDSLTNITLLDCDTLLSKHCIRYIGKIFQNVPKGVPVSLFSNSWNKQFEPTAKLISPKYHLYEKPAKNLRHWFVPIDPRKRQEILGGLCATNPLGKGIVFSNQDREAVGAINILRSRQDIKAKAILQNDLPKHVIDALRDFQNGRISYLCVSDQSPEYVLSQAGARVVINYTLNSADVYSKRSHCTGYRDDSVHIISMVSPMETDVFEEVERICGVTIDELPKNIEDAINVST